MPYSGFTISEFPDLQYGSIYCIGRNYAKHAKEMGSETPSKPVVFLKPRSSLVYNNGTITLPPESKNVHHEVELVVLIGSKVQKILPEKAHEAIRAVAIGLDLTARDLQSEAKQKGLPWSLAKGFDTFAPVGKFTDYTPSIDLQNLDIEVRINNKLRQSGNTSQMIFPVADLISYLSRHFTLYPGDLIFTGTPEGVGPVKAGDSITATLQHGLSTLDLHAH
ncbi:MAG: fumarylacetoacetate hydrolase family protein [Balneolaceae bacterium]